MITVDSQRIIGSKLRIGIPEWENNDDISCMIAYELRKLGHLPKLFPYNLPSLEDMDLLLTFGPLNNILPLWKFNAEREVGNRPLVIHWNTEGIPDLRIPGWVIKYLGELRSKVGRMGYSRSSLERNIYRLRPVAWIDKYFLRYRYYGDYHYAYRKGWLHFLYDTSTLYSEIRTRTGVPTHYAPWGSSDYWYKDLNIDRDIDLLWMGKRGTQRRSQILDYICKELRSREKNIFIADNQQNPYIFGERRTKYLNRAKITLNVTRTWYDDNFSRFLLAASNRSLVVSEPVLNHCPEFKRDIHYVAAEIKDLPKTILYFLENEQERREIAENAYQLVTKQMPFHEILMKMLEVASVQKSPVA
jgi:hypothetical protein